MTCVGLVAEPAITWRSAWRRSRLRCAALDAGYWLSHQLYLVMRNLQQDVLLPVGGAEHDCERAVGWCK